MDDKCCSANFGGPKKLEHNIKLDVQEERFEDFDWNYLDESRAQLKAFVKIVMSL